MMVYGCVQAIDQAPEDAQQRAVYLCNAAACYIKKEMWQLAAEQCTQALKIDDAYLKVRMTARAELCDHHHHYHQQAPKQPLQSSSSGGGGSKPRAGKAPCLGSLQDIRRSSHCYMPQFVVAMLISFPSA